MTIAPEFAVLITAAGRGTRAGGDLPKQWRTLAGLPVLARTVAAFADFARVVVVVHPDDMDRAVAVLGGAVTLVAGADTRSGSVRAGLDVLDGSGVTHVLIHDGARPLVSPRGRSRASWTRCATAPLRPPRRCR